MRSLIEGRNAKPEFHAVMETTDVVALATGSIANKTIPNSFAGQQLYVLVA